MKLKETKCTAEKIRSKYTPSQPDELEQLIRLDKEISAPAKALAYILGTVAALVMGSGMSLIMTDIGQLVGIESPLFPGLILGLVGMTAAIVNYPIYKRYLASRRKKYADKIITLSDRIISD